MGRAHFCSLPTAGKMLFFVEREGKKRGKRNSVPTLSRRQRRPSAVSPRGEGQISFFHPLILSDSLLFLSC